VVDSINRRWEFRDCKLEVHLAFPRSSFVWTSSPGGDARKRCLGPFGWCDLRGGSSVLLHGLGWGDVPAPRGRV
jgi:hypothetical protein